MKKESFTTRSGDLDLLFNLSPDMLSVSDFDGRLLIFNPAWEKTLGYSTDELQSTRQFSFVHPDDLAETLDVAASLTRKSINRTLVNRFRCKDGAYKWLRWNCASDISRNRILSVARDITETRTLQDDLRELNTSLDERVKSATKQLNSIIAASPHAIVAVDGERNVNLWNSAAARIFGWTQEEVLGGKVPFVTEERREDSKIFNQRAMRGETLTNFELQRHHRNGTAIDLLVSAAPTLDDDGTVNGFLTVATDITEHKKLEDQFLRTQRLESLGTLAGGIAHDLNNVLAPISMALELFRMKATDPAIHRTLDTLGICVKRGADLIRQILTFARGVQGERASLQTRHLLQETEKVIAQTLPKSITITSDLPRDLWPVFGDTTQLNQVMMNLCVNARDAMPDGGALTVTAKNIVLDDAYVQMCPGLSKGPHICIEVADTGCGIPAEVRDKIFEPFFTTKAIGGGTGLGLSTVAAIVKSHAGFVSLYSEVERGTSFKVYLPALPSQEAQRNAEERLFLPTGAGELILIVDDEEAVRDIARLTLEAHGYRVLEAQDGADGVAVYAQHRDEIRLVVSDMDMPVMNGAAMIRSLERINPHVRVISASGLAPHGKAKEPSDSAFRKALPKPYTAEQLLRMVSDVLKAA